jgi:hypothetical protein
LYGDGSPAFPFTPSYGMAGCAGSVYYQAFFPNGTGTKSLANRAFASIQTGQFFVPANPDASGLATAATSTIGSQWSTSNNSCANGAFNTPAWQMTPVTRAQIGLPNTIAPPLRPQ